MAKRSRSPGANGQSGIRVPSQGPPVVVVGNTIASSDETVSVSLKYYRPETECFSSWSHSELKKFSATLEKMRNMTARNLQNHLSLCSQHKTERSKGRYVRPKEMSNDLRMYEIRVDQHNKARIHGVFQGSVFHLVWLDRAHMVFPS